MNGLALVTALALSQAPAAEPAAAPTPEPAASPASGGVATEAGPARAASEPAAVTTTVRRRRVVTQVDPLASTSTTTSTSTSPTSTSTRAPTATAHPTRPLPEREDAERAARAFLDALVRGDADALAAASGERFSFDGDVQTGREAVRRAWRALLAARERGGAPAVGAVEVLAAADAAARHGKPPARLAPLVRPGVLVAVADVGGRTVVVFLGREGGRMAALGLHD